MVRAKLEWAVPMCVPVPAEVPSPEDFFPFSDGTLDDLGILPSAVKEQVVWMDSMQKWVRNGSGNLKETEVMVLELRVKAQEPGQRQSQEIVYSTESLQPWKHTPVGEPYALRRKGPAARPWKHTPAGEPYAPRKKGPAARPWKHTPAGEPYAPRKKGPAARPWKHTPAGAAVLV